MAEKKGFPGKIKYDFNEARCCEIEYKPGKWGRVTGREFRSFNGNRRILNIDNPDNVFYEDYNGPVYLFETNTISKCDISGMQYLNNIDPRDKYRKQGKWRI